MSPPSFLPNGVEYQPYRVDSGVACGDTKRYSRRYLLAVRCERMTPPYLRRRRQLCCFQSIAIRSASGHWDYRKRLIPPAVSSHFTNTFPSLSATRRRVRFARGIQPKFRFTFAIVWLLRVRDWLQKQEGVWCENQQSAPVNPSGSAIPFTPQLAPRFLNDAIEFSACHAEPTKIKSRATS